MKAIALMFFITLITISDTPFAKDFVQGGDYDSRGDLVNKISLLGMNDEKSIPSELLSVNNLK